MRSHSKYAVAAFAATALFAGCKTPADDDSGPPKPQTVAFQGALDDKFVGDWKTADSRSELVLSKDGALAIVAVAATPSGDRTSHLSGAWLISGGSLLLKYSEKGQSDTVIRYDATLSGTTLTLLQGRIKSVYTRK